MMPDLSSFYHHSFDYDVYVWMAYGVSAVVLILLLGSILLKYRRLKKDLIEFEEKSVDAKGSKASIGRTCL